MFNIGPLELIVIALVGLVVLGPDKLPGLAKDAARMLKTLRELSTGARTQLRNELGPEFGDLDLQALRDLRALNPRAALRDLIMGEDEEIPLVKPPSAPMANPKAVLTKDQPDVPKTPAPYDQDAT